MEPHAVRDTVRQLADDFEWLEDHCRKQPELAPHAGRLRLAAALTRNVVGPGLDGRPPKPLFVAVVGGAGAGKSTVVNLLAGAVVADANPQAGFTRHPTAYLPAGAENLPTHLGFLGPLRRLAADEPANLDEDVYQVRRTPAAADDPLAGFVVWDCPDMTTWAAAGYVSRLIEVSALADVLVYVASDERYNDAVPTEFLKMLVRAGKAVVVVLTKMREPDAAALTDHFRVEVLAKVAPGGDIPPVPVVTIPNLPPDARADFAGAAGKYRAQLVNQILVLCPDAAAARARTLKNAVAFLEAASDGLLDVARADLAELDSWTAAVTAGRGVFETRYRNEYLAGEPFRRFDRTREQILAMLELPSGGRYASAVFQFLRVPFFYLRELFSRVVTRPPAPTLPEGEVLSGAYAGWVEALQAETLRRAGTHPVWRQIAGRFEAGLRADADDQFRRAAREFELKESDELERAAKSLSDSLASRPGLLTLLRGLKVALDVAAVVLVLVFTWVPSWYHFLLIPLAVAATHQAFELAVMWTVDVVRHRARLKRESLLAEQLSGPFAAWLADRPVSGGSAVDRLRQALARVPVLVKGVAAAAASPAPPVAP